jgi:hypothetical protein
VARVTGLLTMATLALSALLSSTAEAGGSEERRLMYSVIDIIVTDWSHDGRYVVYGANELGTNWNI